MADDIAERIAMLETTVRDLWKCVDELYGFNGRQSPRWAHDQRRDMALYYERRRKALASGPSNVLGLRHALDGVPASISG